MKRVFQNICLRGCYSTETGKIWGEVQYAIIEEKLSLKMPKLPLEIEKSQLEKTKFVKYAHIVEKCIEAGDRDTFMHVFKKFKSERIPITIDFAVLLIQGFSLQKDIHAIRSVISELIDREFINNDRITGALLKAYSVMGEKNEFDKVLNRRGLEFFEYPPWIIEIVLQHYLEIKFIGKVMIILTSLESQSISLNITQLEILIHGLFQMKRLELVEKYIQIVLNDLIPTSRTFEIILSGYQDHSLQSQFDSTLALFHESNLPYTRKIESLIIKLPN